MLVRDLMVTEVVTLDASDTLDLADDIMRLGRIRHMPIVSDRKLVGILSQRDLFRAAISSVLQFRSSTEREWLAKVKIREVMTAAVFSVQPTAPLREAVEMMLNKKIGCVVVIAGDRIVGLLSEGDCLRYLARLLDVAETKAELPELESD
ncbi:MAG: CBS domain-containing protein [Deltaproteobacteria bacterium]|nr:CBS domain-containing protein [Deltaproteobacteria bacterium]MBI3386964.1 CBS domain-containing protein [Deltaproteobacteria bacterium]